MSSGSYRSHSRQKSQQKPKPDKHKIFVTNLDGSARQEDLKAQLEPLFSKYGNLKNLEVKKSKNGEYHFAFVEYGVDEDAQEAIRNLNNYNIKGKPMKVQLQDDSKRRKDPDKGCYNCGRKGHFARQCRSRNEVSNYRGRRSRSRSSSDDRRKKKKNRSPSSDSQRGRSRNKKDRKRSKDKNEKKKKKHKKNRYRDRSSSDSRS